MAGRPMHAGERDGRRRWAARSRARRRRPGRAARGDGRARAAALRVVFEDDDVVVVDKPAGLLTAPTPESDRNNLAESARAPAGRGARCSSSIDRPRDQRTGRVREDGRREPRAVGAVPRLTISSARIWPSVAGAFPDEPAAASSAGGRAAGRHARGDRNGSGRGRRCSRAGSRRAGRTRSACTCGGRGTRCSATALCGGRSRRRRRGWRCTRPRSALPTRGRAARCPFESPWPPDLRKVAHGNDVAQRGYLEVASLARILTYSVRREESCDRAGPTTGITVRVRGAVAWPLLNSANEART